LAICERFSNGITTTASGGAAAGAFEGGLMNENPWANTPAHKKDNAPNAAAIRFANPKIANCKTVDLTKYMIAGRVPQKIGS
jgi:hypothetical protein